jgi:hypothetical protein
MGPRSPLYLFSFLVLLLLATTTAAQQTPPPKTIEAPNRRDIRSEPVFKGVEAPAIDSAKLPPASIDEGESLFDGAKWHTEDISLGAKQKKTIPVDLSVPSTVLAKLTWKGAGAPVRLTLLKGNAVVAEGGAVTLLPGGGSTHLGTVLPGTGGFTLSIENVSGSPANISVALVSVPQARKQP